MRPFGGHEAKSDKFALVECSLVHFRALELEDYAAFLRSRSEHTFIVQSHYVSTPINHVTAHPIFRKIRLSSYFRNQLADLSLITKLRPKFGDGVYFL